MAASSRTSLISMLDPQAQMSINKEKTGTATYTTRSRGAGSAVTAAPTVVSNGVTEDQANIIQGQSQVYDPAVAQLEAKKAAARAWAAANNDTIYSGSGPAGSGSGSGSGSGAGAGSTSAPSTSTTTSTPPTPTGPDAPAGAPGGAEALSGYTEDEISAALAGLEAQFGMTREQLLADQTQAGAQYRLLLAQLERGRVQGIETATNDAVRRGIYRSGILGENIADVETQTLEGRAQAEQGLQARQQATDAQLRNLEAMQQAQAAQIEAGLRRQYAQTLMEAGINPGGYNPNGIGQGGAPGGGTQQQQVGGYFIDENGMAAGRVDGARPPVNTQGVGAQSQAGLLPTEVLSQQAQGQQAPAPIPTATTNVSPAYQDPRQAELAMQQYMLMLNGGTRTSAPGYSPGGGYRVY